MVPVFHLQMLLRLLCVITGANICSDLLNFNKMMLFLFEFYLAIPEPQVLLFNHHTSTGHHIIHIFADRIVKSSCKRVLPSVFGRF